MGKQKLRRIKKRREQDLRKMDLLYQSLPTIQCKGLCHESCGPIAMSAAEWSRLHSISGRRSSTNSDFTCTYLTEDKRCSVYENRPLICRLYGLVPQMKCPHGCEPSRWLTDQESLSLISHSMIIGGEPRYTQVEGIQDHGDFRLLVKKILRDS